MNTSRSPWCKCWARQCSAQLMGWRLGSIIYRLDVGLAMAAMDPHVVSLNLLNVLNNIELAGDEEHKKASMILVTFAV